MKKKKAFLSHIGRNIPVISIASKVDGYEYVVFDNEGSVTEAVDHLIRHSKSGRVGMISGYISNTDCAERVEGYKKALEKNGIEVDESLICYANPSRECKNDVEKYLDEHPDVDAIFCSNDDMCLAVYEVCADRGMMIGSDMLIAGFDDMDYCESSIRRSLR